jgi:hypothetical protein
MRPSTGRSNQSFDSMNHAPQPNTHVQMASHHSDEQGFFASLWSSIVTIFAWIFYIVVGIVCLFLLKTGCEAI